MKLKNVLVLAFLTLTLIPTIVVSFLLYKSSFDLAKESYSRNLSESIHVQADYISQAIQGDMIFDYRFVHRNVALLNGSGIPSDQQKNELLTAMQNYLQTSEDKVTACILLNKDNVPLYTIGEKSVMDTIEAQLPKLSDLTNQTIMEFELHKNAYSLGIVTPVRDSQDAYLGSLIFIYDQSYIFKIISSYYKIANTSTYICRGNGEIVHFRQLSSERSNAAIEKTLDDLHFAPQGAIDIRADGTPLSGYYKNIQNTPWYLVGFVDHSLIYAFTNKFISVYILIVACVLLADIFLSFYFSGKVVEPIKALVTVMERYQHSLDVNELNKEVKNSYFEIDYLHSQFTSLMRTILLVRHNFEGMYQLYQSSDMDDTNIEIDVKNQTARSNKLQFQKLIDMADVPVGVCVVENFIACFCEKDQPTLRTMLETMRDEHLAVTREAEVYTPHLNQKWFHTLVVPIYENESLARLFIQLRDISSFKKKEMESLEMARRDALTGLFNRVGFSGSINKAVFTEKEATLHALLFLDMNSFKLVNDTLGHGAGDSLLQSIASDLLKIVGPENIVSRFGGDEFAVFMPATSPDAMARMVERIRQLLVYPFHTEDCDFTVTASIGTTTWSPTAPTTLDALLQQADIAMYQDKRQFKECQPPKA